MRRILPILIMLCAPMAARATGFGTPVSGDYCSVGVTSGTTLACTLTNQPGSGAVVLVHGLLWDGTHTIVISSVSDGTNTFTKFSGTNLTTGCETDNPTVVGDDCGAYLIEPNGSGGKTITLTVSGTTGCSGCDMTATFFPVTGGTAAIDSMIGASGGSGNPNSPTITVSGSSELAWGAVICYTPTTGVSGAWTEDPNGQTSNNQGMAEYQLSVSTNQTVAFTQTSSHAWSATGASFKFTASGGSCAPELAAVGAGAC